MADNKWDEWKPHITRILEAVRSASLMGYVIGIRTDFRGSEGHGLNLMLSNACSELIVEPSTTTSLERLVERIVRALTASESVDPPRASKGSLLP